MLCTQPGVNFPVNFEGESAHILISADGKRMWVCVDGQCTFRAKVTTGVITVNDQRKSLHEVYPGGEE